MKKIFSLFAAILFAGSMMAESITITPASGFKSSYNNAGTFTIGEVEFAFNAGVMYNGKGTNGLAAKQLIQLRKSGSSPAGEINNTTELNLKSIAIATQNDQAFTLSVGTEADKLNAVSGPVKTTDKYASKTKNDADTLVDVTIYTFDVDGMKYFDFLNGDKAQYLAYITIELGSGEGPAVYTPTFSPAEGTYNEPKNIELKCATEGAKILYTTDGTDPIATSATYSTAFVLDKDTTITIKAIAVLGTDTSKVAEATYKIVLPKVFASLQALWDAATPAETPVTVTLTNLKINDIYTSSKGVRKGIYVDVQDGDDNDIEIYCNLKDGDNDVVVPAAWGPGGNVSGTIIGTWKYYNDEQWEVEVTEANWNWSKLTYEGPAVEVPVFSPASSDFDGEVTVTLTCATAGATIYYTLDNTIPSASSTEYTDPFKLTETTHVRAIAIKGSDKSELVYKQYVKSDVLTCADAAAAALAGSTDQVVVKGYVTAIAYDWKDKSMSFWMDDAKGTKQTIEAYKCAIEKVEDAVKVGDYVKVTGKLTKYNTTPEFAAGCTCVILERDVPPVNLGAKTIAEFLELKNIKDTCVLTGKVSNIAMDKDDATKYNKYGNFDLTDATGTVYVYGLLNAAGESGKFIEMGINNGDDITIKAVYYEYIKDATVTPQAKNAVLVSKNSATSIDNSAVEVKATKRIENGQLIIEKAGVRYNAVGQVIR